MKKKIIIVITLMIIISIPIVIKITHKSEQPKIKAEEKINKKEETKKDGQMISMKANITDEIEKSSKIQKKYNCKIVKQEEFLLPKEESKRTLLVIEKS